MTLDLRALMLETADRIGIRSQVENQVSQDAGRIELLRSDELDTAQDGVQLLETLAWLLPLLTLAAFGLALWLAIDRRVAVRGIGITMLVVGILGLVATSLAGSYLVGELVNESDVRPAADNAWGTFTDLLRAAFGWMIAFGVLFVAASWLAGSGRRALALRRVLAPAVAVRPWAYAGLAVVLLIVLVVVPGRQLPAAHRRLPGGSRRNLDRGDASADRAGVPRHERLGDSRRRASSHLELVGGTEVASRITNAAIDFRRRPDRETGHPRRPACARGAHRRRVRGREDPRSRRRVSETGRLRAPGAELRGMDSSSRAVQAIVLAGVWLVVVLGLRFALRHAFARYERRLAERDSLVAARRRTTFSFLLRIVIALVVLIGVWSVLSVFPVTQEVASAFLASGAVLALVAGVSLSTPLGNLGSGVLLAFTQPARLGDRITVGEHTGVVAAITLSYTELVTDEGTHVFVPNTSMVSTALVNRSVGAPRG